MPAFFAFRPNRTMPANNNKNRIAAACMLLASANCDAADLSIAGELMYFDYEETDIDGSRLNTETGFIPGFSIAASRPSRSARHSLEFSLYGGDVNYDGQTQAGVPHQTTTEQTIYRLQYRVSSSLETTDADLYGKIYWQQWDRDIQPNAGVSGLFERYQWWSIEAGVEVPLMRKERQDLLLELGVLTTLNGTILVDLSDAGFGEPELDLGSGIGFSGEIRYEVVQSNNSSLHFGVSYRTWEFGRSNSAIITNGIDTFIITEPDSQTAQTRIFARYAHRF